MYGGFFILLSFAWGWAVDKERPDTGKHAPRTLLQLVCSAFPMLRACLKMTAAVHVAVGDCIGALIAIVGVAVAFFFPR